MSPSGHTPALLTDLYELTMAASYFEQGMDGEATFELSFRGLPGNRNFLLACGIDEAINSLADWSFSPEDCDYLRTLDLFDDGFVSHLGGLRFGGSVDAVEEGEIVFSGEPVLAVTAPLIQAQLIETLILTIVNYQTAVASKAARIQLAAAGRAWVDFSARRDHGAEASLRVARAAYMAGATGTSNVLASSVYGIPLSGTMAHSYVLAFEDQAAAFRTYSRRFPQRSILLIDTYDTLQGARIAAGVADELREEGIQVTGVRLDSGDPATLSRAVRSILDAGGQPGMRIFVSGDLDEFAISELVAAGAPIDAFGVGTRLGVVEDAPALGGVYKLVEYDGRGVMKESTGKPTLPGRKRVFRTFAKGSPATDIVALADEIAHDGEPLLTPALRDGDRVRPAPVIDSVRARVARRLGTLPDRLRALRTAGEPYEVSSSPKLRKLSTELSRNRTANLN